MTTTMFRSVVVAATVAASVLVGCSSEPPLSEQRAIAAWEATEELHALADQAVRDGRLGDREERLAWMEEAAIQARALPDQDPPLREPELLPERRFWTADGMLKPLDNLSPEELDTFFSWVARTQTVVAIDADKVPPLVGRSRRGF